MPGVRRAARRAARACRAGSRRRAPRAAGSRAPTGARRCASASARSSSVVSGCQAEPAAVGPGGRLDEALGEDRRVLAGREHDQHAVGDEPPHDEQQRAQRRHVGPVGVVDEEHDRVLVLQRAEQLEDPRARAEVIRPSGGGGGSPGAAQQLVDDAERQVALRLVAARAQDGDVARRRRGTARRATVLPMPAGPSTSTSQGWPARACASPSSSASSSRCRPTKTERAGGVSSCLCVAMLSTRNVPRPPPRRRPVGMGIPLSRSATASALASGAHARRAVGPVRGAVARVLAGAAVVVERRHA